MATTSLITGLVEGTGAFSPVCTFELISGSGALINTTVITSTFVPSATGVAVVRVRSAQDPTKFGDVTVTVLSAALPVIVFDGDFNVLTSYNDNATFTSNMPVTWSVISKPASGYLIISNNQTATYWSGLDDSQATATIRAVSIANPTVSATLIITIIPYQEPVPVLTIEVINYMETTGMNPGYWMGRAVIQSGYPTLNILNGLSFFNMYHSGGSSIPLIGPADFWNQAGLDGGWTMAGTTLTRGNAGLPPNGYPSPGNTYSQTGSTIYTLDAGGIVY